MQSIKRNDSIKRNNPSTRRKGATKKTSNITIVTDKGITVETINNQRKSEEKLT